MDFQGSSFKKGVVIVVHIREMTICLQCAAHVPSIFGFPCRAKFSDISGQPYQYQELFKQPFAGVEILLIISIGLL